MTYRILAVDDETGILEVLELTLEKADQFDAEVSTAEDAESALDKMDETDYDVIISDHRMEEMDGVELLSLVKDNYPDTVRMMITGHSDLELAKEAINRAQVYNYIEKPWEGEEMREMVADALKEREKIQEEGEEVSEMDISIEDGVSYLFKENKPKRSFELSFQCMEERGRGLVISRLNPDKIKGNFGQDENLFDCYWLTTISGKKNLNPVDLEIIADKIITYCEEGGEMVFLEGIECLIRNNSFERFVGFLNNIVDVAEVEDSVLMVTLDPRTISDRELAQIKRKMEVYDLEGQ
ncbi:MAG: DUF835 domain-containing protein [Candidatus Thermoplasmatota archaeon]